MAIIPKKDEGATPNLRYSILALIAMMVLGSLVAFFWPVSLPSDFKETLLNRTEKKLSELQLNLTVLQDPVFQSLTSYGEFPLKVTGAGRENPFDL